MMDIREHTRMLAGLCLILIVASALFVWYLFFNQNPNSAQAFLWRQASVFGFDNFGTATCQSGVLYAPSKGDNKLYALNASNGNIIWSRQVRQCDGSPYIDTDLIYVGECSGPNGEPTPAPKAMALNRSSGEVMWTFTEPGNATWIGSPVVNNQFVYYTTLGTGVYALNKTNGNPIWHQNIGKVVCSVACDRGLVFVSANTPPGQYGLNASTGEIVWNKTYGSSWDSSPVVYEGMVVQTARSNGTDLYSTYILNEMTGELITEFDGRGGQSTPLIHEDTIFIPSQNCRIWAYNLKTGTELWHTAELTTSKPELLHPDLSYCSPALANGTIYYQSLSGTFYAIDEATGNILWSRELGGYGFGSPSIGGGRVFITNDSALYAFAANSLDSEWPMFCKNNLHQSYAD